MVILQLTNLVQLTKSSMVGCFEPMTALKRREGFGHGLAALR